MKVGSHDLSWDISEGDVVAFASRDGRIQRGSAVIVHGTHLRVAFSGRFGGYETVYPGEILYVTDRTGKEKPMLNSDAQRRHNVT